MQHKFRNSILAAAGAIVLVSCTENPVVPDYREEMRGFVIEISNRGEQMKPGFIVIPQNGLQLLTDDGTANGNPSSAYVAAIDGCGQEELFYGYENQNNFKSQDYEEPQLWLTQCQFATSHNLEVLVTDYCSAPDLIADSYAQCDARGFLGFAAESRELDLVPTAAHNEDTFNILSLPDAQNFLYMINPNYETKDAYLTALEQSHHDVIIMDAFFNDQLLDTSDLARLRTKPQGGTRLVIAYMSIGQAEDYRWYWKPVWTASPPAFLDREDPYWAGNYYVNYWDPAWQYIICGSGESYVGKVVQAGFDGVYLDLVNAFEYFENK